MTPSHDQSPRDRRTAAAFAESWNRQSGGSVYTREQFDDWFAPLDTGSFAGKRVLELGFGNASLLYHMAWLEPSALSGIELGDTLDTARRNLAGLPESVLERVDLHEGDLTTAELGLFDLVYCIGVLHHLQDPGAGFRSVLRHTRPGGRFHCWVYAREGNAVVRTFVDPIRRATSRLPWWFTKYAVAMPLVIPYYVYAKLLRALFRIEGPVVKALPLGSYSLWIAAREFHFFHHVAFDQLVTPRTVYFTREQVEACLAHPDVEPESTYVLPRNGNSWTFGGTRRKSPNELASTL